MALVNVETYFSFPNIDSTNSNFRNSPDNGTTWVDYITDGTYELLTINSYIKPIMKDNGHSTTDSMSGEAVYFIRVSSHTNTLKSLIEISGN
jgi:hypothetical protein